MMTKPFHAGHAASAGVLAALLASDGFTAAPDPFQGRRGMFQVMSTHSTPEDLIDGLGSRWEIFRNGVKPYACGVVTHPPIDAVRRLRTEHGLGVEDIEGIELQVHPLVLELTGKAEPRTGLEGKFSVLFACAIALLDGTAGEQKFSDSNVVRSDVRALMSRITLVPSESLNHSQAIATARASASREVTVSIEHATGTPDNRIDDSDLAARFHLLVDPVLGSGQAEELEALVWQVDGADQLDALLDKTVPPTA